ncbi:MAG: O-antigen ligase family protein [Bacteroidota bacterium]|nr:O-antigen ligase family protein [Bacteroidota bacterium]
MKLQASRNIFLVILFVIPFIQINIITEYSFTPKFLVVIVGFCLFFIQALLSKNTSKPYEIKLHHLLLFALIVYATIKIPFTINPYECIVELSLLIMVLMLSMIFSEQLKIEELNKIRVAIIIQAVIYTALIGWQIANVINAHGLVKAQLNVITLFSGNKNLTASFLFISAVTLSLIEANKDKKNWSVILLIIIQLACSSLLLSRAVLLGILIAITIYVLGIFCNRKYLIAAISIVFLAILFFHIGVLYDFINLDERTIIWKKSFLLISDNLIQGIGLGNYKIMIAKYGIDSAFYIPSENNLINFIHPHNEFLKIIAELGMIGFFITIWLVYLFYEGILLQKNFEKRNLIILASASGFIIICVFDMPLHRIEHLVYLIFWGCLFSIDISKTYFHINSKVFYLSGLAISIALLIIIGNRYHEDMKYANYCKQFIKKNYNYLINHSDVNTRFFATDPNGLPSNWNKALSYFQMGKLDEAFVIFKDIENSNPYFIFNLHQLGVYHAMKGDLVKSEIYLENVLKLNHSYQNCAYDLCLVYAKNNKKDKLKKLINSFSFSPSQLDYINSISY